IRSRQRLEGLPAQTRRRLARGLAGRMREEAERCPVLLGRQPAFVSLRKACDMRRIVLQRCAGVGLDATIGVAEKPAHLANEGSAFAATADQSLFDLVGLEDGFEVAS